MKVGDLVKHRQNRTLHLIIEVINFKGVLAYVHLEGFPPQEVIYPSILELVSEAG